jgi:hypothetical protein
MSQLETRSAYGLEAGTPELTSVGPIAFGPDGILFVADNAAAAIFAIELRDEEAPAEAQAVEVEDLDGRLAAFLGCGRADVSIRDLAVHPVSQAVYLSVMRGAGDAALPLLVRVAADGTLAEVPLENVPCSRTAIADAPAEDDERRDARVVTSGTDGEVLEVQGMTIRVAREPLRTATVTDLAYVDGTLLVAGASNEEFASTLRRIPFPFGAEARSNSLEIFHVSHGKYETASPIRFFVPYGDGASILASYTCTPVVHFRVGDLEPGAQAKGRTVAELGPINSPLGMVSYERDGAEYLLVSNTRHALLKLACSDIDGQEPLTEPREPIGVPREELPQTGVSRMANLNGSHVLMLQQDGDERLHLRSYSCASL